MSEMPKRCYRIYKVDTSTEESAEKDARRIRKHDEGKDSVVYTRSVSIVACE
jgi:hypothetical protein